MSARSVNSKSQKRTMPGLAEFITHLSFGRAIGDSKSYWGPLLESASLG